MCVCVSVCVCVCVCVCLRVCMCVSVRTLDVAIPREDTQELKLSEFEFSKKYEFNFFADVSI